MTDYPIEPSPWDQFYADVLAGRPASISFSYDKEEDEE